MDNTFSSILKRKSIRKYKDQQVPGDLVQDLLQAAMSAPSACNQQPWHFIVIDDKKALNEISMIHGGYDTLKQSPLAILICGEPSATKLAFYWEHDCAAATENMLIAAQAIGLGAVWLGVNPTAEGDSKIIRRVLNIPDHINPFSFVSVGYPAETIEPSNRFDENKVHYASWSEKA